MDYYKSHETIDPFCRRIANSRRNYTKLNSHARALDYSLTNNHAHFWGNKVSSPPYNRIQVLVYQTPTSIYAANESEPSKFQWPSGKFPNILVVQFAFA